MSIMRFFIVASFLALSTACGLFSAETSPSVQDQSKKKNADDDPKTFLHASETFQASGIGEALSGKEPYETAAAGRGILLKGEEGVLGGGVFREFMKKELALKCDDEVRRGFVLALRSEIERIIASKGATINGKGSDNQGRRFRYAYQWRANEGIIYGFLVDDKQESLLIVVFYEHRR